MFENITKSLSNYQAEFKFNHIIARVIGIAFTLGAHLKHNIDSIYKYRWEKLAGGLYQLPTAP